MLAHPLSQVIANYNLAIHYYNQLRHLVDRGTGFTEGLVIGDASGLPIGDRYLFDCGGNEVACFAARPAWNEFRKHLPSKDSRPRPVTRNGVVVLPSSPRVTLLVVGGGHVGQAVARLAAEVGFGIWVLKTASDLPVQSLPNRGRDRSPIGECSSPLCRD